MQLMATFQLEAAVSHQIHQSNKWSMFIILELLSPSSLGVSESLWRRIVHSNFLVHIESSATHITNFLPTTLSSRKAHSPLQVVSIINLTSSYVLFSLSQQFKEPRQLHVMLPSPPPFAPCTSTMARSQTGMCWVQWRGCRRVLLCWFLGTSVSSFVDRIVILAIQRAAATSICAILSVVLVWYHFVPRHNNRWRNSLFVSTIPCRAPFDCECASLSLGAYMVLVTNVKVVSIIPCLMTGERKSEVWSDFCLVTTNWKTSISSVYLISVLAV